MKIKPLILFKEGEIFPTGVVRARKKSYEKMIEQTRKYFKESGENPDDYELPMNKCYSLTIAEAKQCCDYLGEGTAVVREKEYNDRVVYELLSYNY